MPLTFLSALSPLSDLVYEEPHEGRQGVMQWLEKVGGLARRLEHGVGGQSPDNWQSRGGGASCHASALC